MTPIKLPTAEDLHGAGYWYDGVVLSKDGIDVCATLSPASEPKVKLLGKTFSAARVAFLLHSGREPKGRLKHVDNNRHNLSFGNLEEGHSQSSVKKASKAGRSKNHGLPAYVYPETNREGDDRYYVQVFYQKKHYYIGYGDLRLCHWMAYLTDRLCFPETTRVTMPAGCCPDGLYQQVLPQITILQERVKNELHKQTIVQEHP